MRRRGLLLLAVPAIAAALVGGGGTAAAESPGDTATDEAATITTLLHPGWNLIGWVGPETPVADLFEEIPALVQVSILDEATGRYLRVRRGDRSPRGGLTSLAPGMGLWLRLGGAEPVVWTRPAEAAGVLLQLGAGRRLAAWSGGPGSLRDALAGFGGALASAHRWNAEAQRYEAYRPGRTGAGAVLDAIAPGDGLWVFLSSPVRWWQQGAGAPPMVFVGDVDANDAAALGAEFRDVTARLAARFEDIEGTEITAYIHAELETLRAAYEAHGGRTADAGLCRYWTRSAIAYATSCDEPLGAAVGRAYFELLRDTVAPLDDLAAAEEGYSRRGPQWLLYGAREYVNALYLVETRGETYEQLRTALIAPARRTTLPLGSLETRDERDSAGLDVTIALGFLATESLVEHAGEVAILDYFRRLPASAGWREAFEAAFGVSVADFHDAFEASRPELAPLLPHLADELDEPAFVFLGTVGKELREALRASLEESMGLFATHFGGEASDFTIYVGSDLEAVAAEYRSVRGRDNPELCGDQGRSVIFQVASCKNPSLVLAHEYVHVLQHQLAGGAPWGPDWLTEGVAVYGEALHRAVIVQGLTVSEGLDERRREETAVLRTAGEIPALRDLETVADEAERIHYRLGFLAADWLAQRAGAEALLGYYRGLPSAEGWQEAFEASFGIAVDDFYTAFEAYRAELVTPEASTP